MDYNQLIVFTGVSGSGKSSLAFDTIYAEGQRRYVESLSNFARRYLGDMGKPDVEHVEGLSPTISIEQKTAGKNPRSTVGTMTEIYDYLRVLYARVGVPHCPISGEPVKPQSRERIIKTVQSYAEGSKIIVSAPYARGKKAEFKDDFQELVRKGFMRVKVDGKMVDLSEEIALDGSVAHDVDVIVDRIVVKPKEMSRIAETVTLALEVGQGVCEVAEMDSGSTSLFSMHAFSPKSGLSYHSLEPHDFSFNSPAGMCEMCQGLGTARSFDLDKIIDPEKSIEEDCCTLASSFKTVRYGNIYRNIAEIVGFSLKTPWKKLSEKAKKAFLYGFDKKWTRMTFVHPTKGSEWMEYVPWRGVLHEAQERYAQASSDSYRGRMEKLMREQICPACHGSRLKPYPAATELSAKRIFDITDMTIGDCADFFDNLNLAGVERIIAEELLKEIRERLRFLKDVGLHYLALGRISPTLSGGEAQRVRLASQIGCGLVGVTYVLDEPSIGLHPRDNKKLISTLERLRDMGNTVIVVEHDEETMMAADHIVDFGPGPGSRGGEIVVEGSVDELLASEKSITGQYLSGRLRIATPKQRKKSSENYLVVKNASHHNLKNIDAKIPLGLFVAVTGVSGSGKSSLVADILHPALVNKLHKGDQTVGAYDSIEGIEKIDKVIGIDQSPIGRNPRSNPSTYIKLFDEIRDLFAMLPESKARGYQPGRFSFNVKEGTCARCMGIGMVKIDLDFLEEAWVECDLCKGRRFDHDTLSVLYKGRNIYDVLEMEVAEALVFFEAIPSIRAKLETLKKVGMEYIKLGQPSTTLSGGEAQRIKLAKELARPSTGQTLYILDEPTTGLHFHDIQHLLKVLHELVDRGNTVLVIEHNMDVVKTADWILDLGPEGGIGGGRIVAQGTPEKVAKMDTPTGAALKEMLDRDKSRNSTKSRQSPRVKETPSRYEADLVTEIIVRGAEQNNLKHLDLNIPRGKMTICTGPSGSGKSSLAFETIYAEGQRRYVESLSPYARQFVMQMPKPKVGQVEGLSPAIAIEQKAHAGNPRSTVGTMTEIYDFLRVLYARVGIPHCPETGDIIKAISKDHVCERILNFPEGTKLQILAPIALRRSERFEDVISRLQRQGYLRIRLNGEEFDLDSEIPFHRGRKNELQLVIDRVKADPGSKNRIYEAIENAAEIGGNKVVVLKSDEEILFNMAFAVERTGKSYPEITPHTFSFNSTEGMCPDCQGLGYQYGSNILQHADSRLMSVGKLFDYLWGERQRPETLDFLDAFLKEEGISLTAKVHKLKPQQQQILMFGSPEGKLYRSSQGFDYRWVGINTLLAKAGRTAKGHIRETIVPILDEIECHSCRGSRLNALARHVEIQGVTIGRICSLPVENVLELVCELKIPQQEMKILEEAQRQLKQRLKFLVSVGLGYIALDRRAPTLSGGEAQRIRLARQLGSSLTGVLYVLDEPTIGLHPRDNDRLFQALDQLKNLGNTLIMVEHDPHTIEKGDYILDFGPGAGRLGGHVTSQGTPKQIKKDPNSLTGRYLSGEIIVPFPKKKRKIGGNCLSVKGAKSHNLKKIDVDIPTEVLTCVTGVSGSGKSTLLNHLLKPGIERGLGSKEPVEVDGAMISGGEFFEQLIVIDQNPIGHTVRANVCTYVDALTHLRRFFAALPEARIRGLQPKHFSYNHRKGMCQSCWGLGYRKVEMHFLPAVKVVCDQCHGMRLNPVSLQVQYAGKSLGEYLQTTVEEARQVFEHIRGVTRILDTLISVGLGYLTLGQEMQTLSGGEAQRLKLSRELSKRTKGKTLYLLDEPTTGLHSDDISKLLKVMHSLVDKKHTMVVIEHNLDIIKNADYIIDLGPDAGEKGGELIAKGTPQQIVQEKLSWTGKYLAPLLVQSGVDF